MARPCEICGRPNTLGHRAGVKMLEAAVKAKGKLKTLADIATDPRLEHGAEMRLHVERMEDPR